MTSAQSSVVSPLSITGTTLRTPSRSSANKISRSEREQGFEIPVGRQRKA
jgi:hypothetical protein